MGYVTRVAASSSTDSYVMGQRFGLVAVIWIVLQISVGAGSVWFGGTLFGGGAKAKAIYKYHR